MLDGDPDKLKSLEERFLPQIEDSLRRLIGPHKGHDSFYQAVEYALFPGGKRIRPLFSLVLCEESGGDCDSLLMPACSLELMHCASLIHDDLPAIDNDDMRRGRPSLHKAFGEPCALLAGDYLIPLAFGVVAQSHIPEKIAVEMVASLSRAYLDLCYGQYLDLLPNERCENLLRVHELKTGALFRTAAEFSAYAAALTPGEITLAAALGNYVGVGFQLVDDYLDIYGSAKERGREGGSDQRNNRYTFCSGESSTNVKSYLCPIAEKIEQSFSLLEASLANKPRFLASRAMVHRILSKAFSV